VEHLADRFSVVYRIEELLPYVSGKPLLCFCPSPGSLCVAVCPEAQSAAAGGVPACGCAVLRFGDRLER
jgi:hypothetical protein